MFTNLHELELGDHFYINILGEIHDYEVDKIQTVLPDDTSHFDKVLDKDYITLVTCTPLGVNSHRLLVRGHRVDNSLSNNINSSKIPNLDKKDHFRVGSVKTIIVIAIIVLLFLFVFLFILRRKKEKNNIDK